MYELAGRIILQDLFSRPLEAMQRKSDSARQAVDALGQAADTRLGPAFAAGATAAGQRIQVIETRLDSLRRRASAPVEPRVSVTPLRQLDTALRESSSGVTGMVKGVEALTKSFGGLYTAVASSAVVMGMLKTGQIALELAQGSAAAATVEHSFRNLAAAAGISSDTLLRELRKASRGTVDEVSLMIAANRALLAGGSEFANVLPGLFEIARGAAQTTGQDVGYVFETLTKGIAKASPMLIDNAEIYIKVGRALEEYAAKQGKTVEMLSATEQRAAMANIVLAQGTEFIKQMGLESVTAADMMQNLPAAWKDLKVAIGDVVVDTGLPMWLAGLAEIVRQVTATGVGARELQKRIDELNFLGKTEEARRFAEELARFQESGRVELQPGELPSAAASRWYSEQAAQADRAILAARGYTEEQLRQAEAAKQAASAQQALADAMAPYTKALNEFRSTQAGPAVLMEQLGQLTGKLDAVRTQMSVPMPKFGETLWADTAALRAWLNALQTGDEAMEASRQATLRALDATDAWQMGQLRALLAMDNNVVALQLLAEAILGPNANIRDLANAFGALPPEVQLAATQLGLFEQMLAQVQSRAADGVTVDVKLQGYETALNELDQIALSLAGVLPADEIRRFRERMRSDFTEHWTRMGDIDAFGMNLQKAIIINGYREIAQATQEHYREVERAASRHQDQLFKSAGELTSAIERAIKDGLDVSPADMALAAAGKYEDKALENARRLDAIIQRGFDELQAHPDWAGLLKIPPEILAGSEAELKAWAAATKADVVDLARPDLINWDAFIENFRRDLDREAGKKLTIDIAVEKLEAAGLLKGMSEEQRKQKVAELLGLQAPKLTIEALFAPQAGARKKLVSDVLDGRTALDVPAVLRLATGAEMEAKAEDAAKDAKPEVQVGTTFNVSAGAAGQLVGDLLSGKTSLALPVTFSYPDKDALTREVQAALDVAPSVTAVVKLNLTENARVTLLASLLAGQPSLAVPVSLSLPAELPVITLPAALQLPADASRELLAQIVGPGPALALPVIVALQSEATTQEAIRAALGLDQLLATVQTSLVVAPGARELFLEQFLQGKPTLEVPATLVFPTPETVKADAAQAVDFAPPPVAVPVAFAVAPDATAGVRSDLLTGAAALTVPVALQYPNIPEINAALAGQLDFDVPPLTAHVSFEVASGAAAELLAALLAGAPTFPIPVALVLPAQPPEFTVPVTFTYPGQEEQARQTQAALLAQAPKILVEARFTAEAGADERVIASLLAGRSALAVPLALTYPDLGTVQRTLDETLALIAPTVPATVSFVADVEARGKLLTALLGAGESLPLPVELAYPADLPELSVPIAFRYPTAAEQRTALDAALANGPGGAQLAVATSFIVQAGAREQVLVDLLAGTAALTIPADVALPDRDALAARLAALATLSATLTMPVQPALSPRVADDVVTAILAGEPALTLPVQVQYPPVAPAIVVPVQFDLGSRDAQVQAVEGLLNAIAPRITVATVFDVPEGAAATLRGELLAGGTSLPIAVALVYPDRATLEQRLADLLSVTVPTSAAPVTFALPADARLRVLAELLAGEPALGVPVAPQLPDRLPVLAVAIQFNYPTGVQEQLTARVLEGRPAFQLPAELAFPPRDAVEKALAAAVAVTPPAPVAVGVTFAVVPGAPAGLLNGLLDGKAALDAPIIPVYPLDVTPLQVPVDLMFPSTEVMQGAIATAVTAAMPRVTLATGFTVAANAGAELRAAILAGAASLPLPVTLSLPDRTEQETLITAALSALLPELPVALRPLVAEDAGQQVVASVLAGAPALSVAVTPTLQEGVDHAGRLVADMRLDSLFVSVQTRLTLIEGAGAELVLAVLQGQPALHIPVTFGEAPLAGNDLTAATQRMSLAPEALAPREQMQALTVAGTGAADALALGFRTQLTTLNMGALLVQAWAAQFVGVYPDFELIGRGAGATVAKAFVQAVKDGIGNVRAEMAAIIAPEVAEIMRRDGSGRRSAA